MENTIEEQTELNDLLMKFLDHHHDAFQEHSDKVMDSVIKNKTTRAEFIDHYSNLATNLFTSVIGNTLPRYVPDKILYGVLFQKMMMDCLKHVKHYQQMLESIEDKDKVVH